MIGCCIDISWCRAKLKMVSAAQHKQALYKADLSVASLLVLRPNSCFHPVAAIIVGHAATRLLFKDAPVMTIASGMRPKIVCNAKLASAEHTTTSLCCEPACFVCCPRKVSLLWHTRYHDLHPETMLILSVPL